MTAVLFMIALALSAFFSGAETAFIGANRLKLILSWRHHEDRRLLVQDEGRFLTTALVGNNLVNTACASLGVVLVADLIGEAMTAAVVTVLLLFFGELLPKSIAAQAPNRFSGAAVRLMSFFRAAFYPLVLFVEKLTAFSFRLLKFSDGSSRLFSLQELPLLVREYGTAGLMNDEDQQLLARALKIRDRRLWDVMVPRTEIVAVSADAPREKVYSILQQSGLSRLPVYRDRPDQIEGIFFIKDIFMHPGESLPPPRRPLFLPASMRLLEALQRLRRERAAMAVVVDEYGGVAGLVSVEDIAEKLVGSINDEFDLPRKAARRSDQRTVIVEGKMPLDELAEMIHTPLPEGDYVTVAGFLMDRLERVPQVGDKAEINGCTLEVMEAEPAKVLKVKITAPALQEEPITRSNKGD